MEGGDQNHGNGGSRWNPTKEQINMLEGFYKQGLRTPTAEQIQQITSRLRDFGHIEGKNVFYWFQNHKARQRQKQKQESFAYYNRSLHTTPVFSPYQHFVCSPFYIPPPKTDPVFYQQYPKVPLPTAAGSFKRSRLILESTDPTNKQIPTCQRYNSKSMECIHFINFSTEDSSHHQETLDLFPIHPTGILQSRNRIHNENESQNPLSCANTTPSIPTSTENEGDGNINGCNDEDDDEHPFFDFFCGN